MENDDKKSWSNAAVAVVSAVVGVAFLIGLLYYAVQQLRLLQDRRSSLTIKVLSDDQSENEEYQAEVNCEDDEVSKQLPYKSNVIGSSSIVELNPGVLNASVVCEQKTKVNQVPTQSTYVTLPPPLQKNV